jgi:hypothetical protein
VRSLRLDGLRARPDVPRVLWAAHVSIFVNLEGWSRRGEQVFHFWATEEAEMHAWASALGFADFVPSSPAASHRVFRHYLLTAAQRDLALSCGALGVERWAITKFVAERTLARETQPELITWAAVMLDKLAKAGHI